MGPIDQPSALVRSLRTGAGTIGAASVPPVSNLNANDGNPLGGGMGGWGESTGFPSARDQPRSPADQPPGGLPGMIQEYMRSNGY
jgi:hypothetical protein